MSHICKSLPIPREMKHWILLVGLMTAIPFAHGQNKKELNTIIDRLKSDSSALQLQIEKEAQTNSKLAQEISECQKENFKPYLFWLYITVIFV